MLQGERRWGALGARLRRGRGPPARGRRRAAALAPDRAARGRAAVALGCVVPVVVGWWALRHERAPGVRGRPPPRPRDPDRGAGQLPGAARLLRPLQPRRRRRPQRADAPRQRPLRRRADPHQGGAVPAAVRRGGRLPGAGLRRRQRVRALAAQPGRRSSRWARSARWRAGCCPRSRWSSWAATTYAADRRPALAVRAARHRARRRCSCWCTPCSPGRAGARSLLLWAGPGGHARRRCHGRLADRAGGAGARRRQRAAGRCCSRSAPWLVGRRPGARAAA